MRPAVRVVDLGGRRGPAAVVREAGAAHALGPSGGGAAPSRAASSRPDGASARGGAGRRFGGQGHSPRVVGVVEVRIGGPEPVSVTCIMDSDQ